MNLPLIVPAPWTADAPCSQSLPDLWFPEKGAPAEPAKAICRSCDVRLTCLRAGLARFEEGVWGGYTERDRQVVRRRLAAGESLADVVAADDAALYERLESPRNPPAPPDPAAVQRAKVRQQVKQARHRARNAANVAALRQDREASPIPQLEETAA